MPRSHVRPSVCPIIFLALIVRVAHIQRDSPGGSTQRGQRTFPSEYYEDGHTCSGLMQPTGKLDEFMRVIFDFGLFPSIILNHITALLGAN